MSLPPGPRLSFVQSYQAYRNLLISLKKYRQEYGNIFSLSLPAKRQAVVLAQPEHLRWAFANPQLFQVKPEQNPFTKILGHHSIFALDQKAHLQSKKRFMPYFSQEYTQNFAPGMLKIVQKKLNNWKVGEELTLQENMQDISLDIIIRMIFGIEEPEKFLSLKKHLDAMLSYFYRWPSLVFPPLQRNLGPLTPWAKFTRLAEATDDFLFQEIQAHLNCPDSEMSILSQMSKFKSEDGSPISAQEIRDHLVSFLIAGHETTATSLSWIFRWILSSPSWKKKLISHLQKLELNDFSSLWQDPLLDAIIKEAMRMNPVIPFVLRILEEETKLDSYTFPAGTYIVIAIDLVHHDRSIYPQPNIYQPQRFLENSYNQFQWCPFGGGVKRCIGLHFAMMEIKIILAATLRQFALELCPKQSFNSVRKGLSFTPQDGVKVMVT